MQDEAWSAFDSPLFFGESTSIRFERRVGGVDFRGVHFFYSHCSLSDLNPVGRGCDEILE